MEYMLNLAAIYGDIIPLRLVAEAMASREATAGGTPFHEPTFSGRLTGHGFGPARRSTVWSFEGL